MLNYCFDKSQCPVQRLTAMASNSTSFLLNSKKPAELNLTSSIFKLNVDCLEGIFEWLSLQDLHTFGETCVRFQFIAGNYFQRNYQSLIVYNTRSEYIESSEFFDLGPIVRYAKLSAFTRYIQNISHIFDDIKRFQLNGDQFLSIIQISMISEIFTSTQIETIKHILVQVEVVKLRNCQFVCNFYANFLKHCKNLKRLYVQDVNLNKFETELPSTDEEKDGSTGENGWLDQKYVWLEYFELTPRSGVKINELQRFFVKNPNIRGFSTNSHCLYMNWKLLIDSHVKLIDFSIDLDCWPDMRSDSICYLLNSLHQLEFYDRLHLYGPYLNKITINQIETVHALNSLYVKHLKHSEHLNNLKSLKELSVSEALDIKNIEDLTHQLINLEKVYLKYGTSNDMLAFIRYSQKLTEIKVLHLKERTHLIESVLDMKALNEERKTFCAGRLVTIYVTENIFLKTKWTIGQTNLKFVRLKRIESYKWEHRFEF